MYGKIIGIALVLLIFFYGLSFAENRMYLRLTGVEGNSSLLPLDGNRSYRLKVRFMPITAKNDPAEKVSPSGYPAFMSLATQVCRTAPGALSIDADKENYSVTILFTASSRKEWVISLVNALTAKLKEERGITVAGWDMDRQGVLP